MFLEMNIESDLERFGSYFYAFIYKKKSLFAISHKEGFDLLD